MKLFFGLLLILMISSACKNEPKQLNEDFSAIGYDGRSHEISLGDSLFMDAPKLKCILFIYHDSLFKVEIDQQDQQHYSLLKANNRAKDTLISILQQYRRTSLKGQLKDIQEHGMKHGCYVDGYFLFGKNEQTQFGLFEFTKYYDWILHYRSKEITLNTSQFPKIYQTIYHTFNSKRWDYYMSNEYHYKELRIHYSKLWKN